MRSGMYRPPLGARPLRTAYRGPRSKFQNAGAAGWKRKAIDLFEGEKIAPASSRKILHGSTCSSLLITAASANLTVYVSSVAEFIIAPRPRRANF